MVASKQVTGDAPGAVKVTARKPKGAAGAATRDLAERLDALTTLVMMTRARLLAMSAALGMEKNQDDEGVDK